MIQHLLRPFSLILFLLLSCCFTGGDSMFDDLSKSASASEIADSTPRPGAKNVDSKGNMHVSNDDRCPVCAMKVMNYPKFSCAIQLVGGRTYYFCATGCMIRAWLHPEIFLNSPRNDIKLIVVRDYFTGEEFNALTAQWVAGSDVIGPMGPALVPLKDENLVEVFTRRHGGKTVFNLQQLDDEKWRAITGKDAAP